MPDSKFDVIVIGSGPAGASAAYRLARDGFKTLVLEKEKLPRYKPCGGAITSKVFDKIDFDITPRIQDRVTQISLAHHNRTLASLKFTESPVSLVMRDEFDNTLTEHAAQAGATVHEAEAVREISFEPNGARVKTKAGDYACEIVVGADGANGITARAANLHQPRSLAAALEVELAVSDKQLDAWRHHIYLDFGALPYGYAWIFPKADHLSVGIGTYLRGPLYRHFAQRAGDGRADLRTRLQEWIAREPTLRDNRVLIERGHLVPLGGQPARLHDSRVVLTGDAGGLIEPFMAEGIYYAMRSGQIAAEVIGEAFRREDMDLAEHTRRVHQEFLPTFQNAAGMARFTYRFPTLSLQTVAVVPGLKNAVGQMMDGQASASGALLQGVRILGNWLDRL